MEMCANSSDVSLVAGVIGPAKGNGFRLRNGSVTGRDCVLCEVLAEAEETVEQSTHAKQNSTTR